MRRPRRELISLIMSHRSSLCLCLCEFLFLARSDVASLRADGFGGILAQAKKKQRRRRDKDWREKPPRKPPTVLFDGLPLFA